MAPLDDLKSHAASSHDFYALLDITPAAGETEIRRAYRKTALKYHPDKIQNPTPADLEKFHFLQIAYDVLSEPTVRQLYDNAREARERKKRETEMLQGVRRQMKEDLEARERGVKRPWAPAGPTGVDVQTAEDKLEQEIRRLAEDGKRRRRAKEELMRREVLEEEERRENEKEKEKEAKEGPAHNESAAQKPMGGTSVSEIDRTVKTRWVREGEGLDLDRTRLESLFSTFGQVESVFTLKDKRQRIGDKREKRTIATGVVVFLSIVGAHAAVEDWKKQHGKEWGVFESVFWASNREPDWESHRSSSPASSQQDTSSTTSVPASNPTPSSTKPKNFTFPGLNTSSPKADGKENASGKAPSFTSFAKTGINKSSDAANGDRSNLGSNSPSLEEITLIRLKNAERKRLEEQIRKEDEAAAEAESGAV